MGLINLQTNLKSLKYGKDRFGGGDSGQPFIKNPLINQPNQLTHSDDDFLLRGGIRAPLKAAEDIARLTKYLFNPKSPSGLLFVAKQNLLSRIGSKTEASTGAGYGGGAVNEGIYTPLSTLAQAGVGFAGIHLNKQGIDPTGLINSLSINTYESVIKKQDVDTFEFTNRLVNLSKSVFGQYTEDNFNNQKNYSLNKGNSVIEYGGGPNSILGIGKTRIEFSDQRTGINNPKIPKTFFNTDFGYEDYSVFKRPEILYAGARIFNGLGVSGVYDRLEGSDLIGDSYGTVNDSPIIQNFPTNVYKEGTLEEDTSLLPSTPKDNSDKINLSSVLGASTDFNNASTENVSNTIVEDNLKNGSKSITLDITNNVYNPGTLVENPNFKDTGVKPIRNTPIYKTKTTDKDFKDIEIEKRVNLGNPGGTKGSTTKILDAVNGSKSYNISGGGIGRHGANRITGGATSYNDLCHLRIGIVDPQNPSNTEYMNFRSYIDSFSDSYGADWKSQMYMGRAEKFYKYNGFDRNISLAFTLAAQSQAEMSGMYQKLNYLASSMAPKYTSAGYMAGNLVKLTVGDYIYEQYGIITGFTYDIPKESPWDLSIFSSLGKPIEDELPMIIKVTGMKFIPIHEFRPEVGVQGLGAKNRFISNKIPFGKSSRLDEVKSEREQILAEEATAASAVIAEEEAAAAAALSAARAEALLENPFTKPSPLGGLGTNLGTGGALLGNSFQ